MKSGFNKILLGFILITLDISIDGFDILPNFLGYCFIYAGCLSLKDKNKRFEKVTEVLPIIIGISILAYFKVRLNLPIILIEGLSLIIFTMSDIYIVYNICKGIYEMAKEESLNQFMKVIEFRYDFYLYSFLAVQILAPFMFNTGNDTFKITLLIVSVISLFAKFLIYKVVSRAKRELI